jgi:hypothetical protein
MCKLLSHAACVVVPILAKQVGLEHPPQAIQQTPSAARDVVAQIQRADYEGDRSPRSDREARGGTGT